MIRTSAREPSVTAATVLRQLGSARTRVRVRGHLDETTEELLREVARAALITMRRADRVHLDLRALNPHGAELPRIVRRMARAGAIITPPPERSGDFGPNGRRRWAF